MSIVQLGADLYGSLIRLYPRPFRQEFEEEMRLVFSMALVTIAREGPGRVAPLVLCELRDLLLGAAQQHLLGRRDGRHSAEGSHRFATWGAWGFGSAFALGSLVRWIAATWSRGQPNTHVAPLLVVAAWYLFAGAIGGAIFGMAFRSRDKVLASAAVGALSFGLSVIVLGGLPRVGALSVMMPWIAAPAIVGGLAGTLAAPTGRRRQSALGLTLAGTWTCGVGVLGGFAVTVLVWGAAQAVWSYHAASLLDGRGLSVIASGLPHLVNVVTGLLSGALLGRAMERKLRTSEAVFQ
ncbi:MAG: hypothetical protein NT169_11340 [Chloroflexi bacterium]|nr:hypothetical protein [Chloroflexota bacterium]